MEKDFVEYIRHLLNPLNIEADIEFQANKSHSYVAIIVKGVSIESKLKKVFFGWRFVNSHFGNANTFEISNVELEKRLRSFYLKRLSE